MKVFKRPISIITILTLAVTMCISSLATDTAHAASPANPADNKIIAPESIKSGESFIVTAIGSNQNLISPVIDDTRYVPYFCVLQDSTGCAYQYSDFNSSNTTICKFPESTKSGTYTLKVVFDLEKYFGSSEGWQWAGNFTSVEKVQTIEVTQIPKYKITLNGNKGKIGKKKSVTKTVTTGKKYGKLPKPKRKNYMFIGWYTKKTGGTKITASTEVTKTSKHTLYARWLGPKGKGKTITAAEYKRIKKGMTYKQVKYLIGGKPYYQDTFYNDDETWTTRAWYGKKKKWEAIILWIDNKVVTKTKVTL